MDQHTSDDTSIGAIILAAGTSSRMGAHKLLLPLGDQPIIAHTVAAVTSISLSPVIVVLGRDATKVAQQLPTQGITPVINPDYATGMASSLRAGISAIPASSTGALILLGDQPLVTPALIETVITEATAHPNAIISASFAGRRGHPVYFPHQLFAELSAITGDEGGKSVIARHATSLRLIDWPDTTTALDADTTKDYTRLQSAWATRNG